jgi:multidrug efflux system outer membrane protein
MFDKNTNTPAGGKRLPAILSVLMMSATLAGCVVGPDYRGPTSTIPAAWSFSKAKQPQKPPELAGWWKTFKDPALDTLIETAIADNLDVSAAKAKVEEARASYRQAGGSQLPTADAAAAGKRTKQSGIETNQFQAGFDASFELDLFGKNRRTVEAAKYGVDAAEEELRLTMLTLVGDIASNYVQARGYQARIALAGKNAGLQRETLALTRTKAELGAGTQLDIANAVGQTATTEAGIPQLKAAFSETVNRLSVLTGQAPGSLASTMAKGSGRLPVVRATPGTGIPADVLFARPDVRLAERKLAQATARVGAAEAARYPSVTLTGSISTSAANIGDLAKSSTIGWGFGPGVNIPLFDAGKLKASADVAKAQRHQTFVAYRAAVLSALEEVENAAVSLTQERLRGSKLSASVAAYREAATLSRSLYDEGASPFTDVLDAERFYYSAEDALIQSRIASVMDYIALNKALGGGWSGSAPAKTK